MRLEGKSASIVSLLVTVFVVGCANDGFRATKGVRVAGLKPAGQAPTPANTGTGEQDGKPTDKVLPSIAIQSPRAQAAVQAAAANQIQMEVNSLSKMNAKQIIGAEVVTTAEGLRDKRAHFRALIEVNGFVGVVTGLVSVDSAYEGQALLSAQVAVDQASIIEGSTDALAKYSFQVVSHCANGCKDLFVHFQINKLGKYYSAAFYNFRLDNDRYEHVSSTVEEEYRNIADAKVYLLQQKPTGEDEDAASTMSEVDGEYLVPVIKIKGPAVEVRVPEVKAPELTIEEPKLKLPTPPDVPGELVVRAKRLTPEEQAAALAQEREEDPAGAAEMDAMVAEAQAAAQRAADAQQTAQSDVGSGN